MNTRILLLVGACTVALYSAAFAQSTPVPVAGPTPLPAEVAAEQFQRAAEAWISVINKLSLVALPVLGGLVAWIVTELRSLKAAHAKNAADIAEVKNAANANAVDIAEGPSHADLGILHGRVDTVGRIAIDAATKAGVAPKLAQPQPMPDPQAMIKGVPSIAVALIACLFFSGCATSPLTTQQKQDAWNEVYSVAIAAGTAALSGEKGQAVSQAAFTAAETGQPVQQLITDAVTMNGGTAAQAQQLNSAVTSAIAISQAKTPAQKVAALNTIGAALQLVANQEFAK